MSETNTNEPHLLEGYGPLDIFLAKQRYKMANWAIRKHQKSGRILDIGCGATPLFLKQTSFDEKYGMDQNIHSDDQERTKAYGINLINHRFEQEETFPLEDESFDVVSLLAVFEHIEPSELVRVHQEIRRVLKPGGLFVMTTPAFWTDGILRTLAALKLISAVSIEEHKDSYSHGKIRTVLIDAGFEAAKIRCGYFELFMNNWVTAIK